MKPDTKIILQDYIAKGTPPDGFFKALLENDLRESFGRADIDNRNDLFEIVSWLWNYAPAMCWGNPQKVRDWVQMKQVERLNHAASQT